MGIFFLENRVCKTVYARCPRQIPPLKPGFQQGLTFVDGATSRQRVSKRSITRPFEAFSAKFSAVTTQVRAFSAMPVLKFEKARDCDRQFGNKDPRLGLSAMDLDESTGKSLPAPR